MIPPIAEDATCFQQRISRHPNWNTQNKFLNFKPSNPQSFNDTTHYLKYNFIFNKEGFDTPIGNPKPSKLYEQ